MADSNFGIICITRENVGSPWILFEAGALAKSMQGSKVIPLLLDLEFRDIAGPLAQFQAKKIDKTGIGDVINSINQTAKNTVPEARAKQLFEALWPEFEKKIKAIPKEPSAAKHARPQHEVLEELVANVRSLDSRLRDASDDFPARHRRMKFHPMMVREVIHMAGRKLGDPIGLLVLASMLREDMPWLYELGMEAYRASKTGLPEEAERAMRSFRRAIDFTAHGPFSMEEIGMHPKELHMLMRELEHVMLDPEPSSDEEPKEKPKRKKDEKEGG